VVVVSKPSDALYASIIPRVAQPAPPVPPPPTQEPPAAPAPVAAPSSAVPAGRRPVQTRDDVVEERPVRVGKIQWPPPARVDDDSRPAVHVGRLDIDENDVKDSRTSTTDAGRQRVNDAHQSQASSAGTQPVRQRCGLLL